ncbi:hypothetical protein MKX01_029277, partial [Papaver californicum]
MKKPLKLSRPTLNLELGPVLFAHLQMMKSYLLVISVEFFGIQLSATMATIKNQ